MPRNLKLYIAGVVTASALALLVTTLAFPIEPTYPIAIPFAGLGSIAPFAGLAFWTAMTLIASATPVTMPRGARFAVSISTIMTATILGGPTAGAWVGLLGTTELREVRGQVPWYGTLANHAGIILPAATAGVVMVILGIPTASGSEPMAAMATPWSFVVSMLGGVVFLA